MLVRVLCFVSFSLKTGVFELILLNHLNPEEVLLVLVRYFAYKEMMGIIVIVIGIDIDHNHKQ